MTDDATAARGRWVPGVALVLIAAQLVVRGLVLADGGFYWDDLILVGRAGQYPLLSPDFLLYDHDGHLMPLAFLLAGVVTKLGGAYVWWPAAASLLILQLLASLAVLRLLRILLGNRPILVLPLVVYLFGALTLPSFAWWAAGLNALPLQAGLAWVAADALRLAETGRTRYALTGTVAFALALGCFEKAILVPIVAAAIVALRGAGLRRCRALWLGCAVVAAAWCAVYLAVVRLPAGREIGAKAGGLVWHGLSRGLVPALLGGPLRWERWLPSAPWSDPPVALVVAGWLALAAAVGVTLYARRGAAWIWLFVAGYVVASQAAMVLARSGPDTTYELAQTLRYLADSSVVLTAAGALLIAAPARRRLRVPRVVPVAATAGFVVIALISTLSFARSWRTDDTPEFLATTTDALAHTDVPLLDQPVPPRILLPVVYPNNLLSHVFAPLRDRPEFATWTTELRMLDDAGRLVPAGVGPARDLPAGPEARCGHRITAVTVIPLSGPLADWEWTAELNYNADRDGEIIVSLAGPDARSAGRTVRVPVDRGLHQMFVRLIGSGTGLRVQPVTPGLEVCLAAGPIGGVLPR